MSENRVHKIIKILMVVILLLLAYFLPGICVKMMGREGETQEQRSGNESGDVSGQESAGENGDVSGQESPTENETSSGQRKFATGQRGTIVLDPGHGGEDPGMVGVGGVKEKEINLQVAQALGNLLEQQGFEVVYTRTTDAGLYDAETANKKAQDMQRRCAVIEEEKPVLSVSIHQNSYSDSSVYGPQVFYFEHSAEGQALASCVQEQLNTQLEIAKPRVIKGNTNYYILKRSEGTTILVECSFLSNPQEAEKIQTAEYQQAVAQAICSGILEYLENKTTDA